MKEALLAHFEKHPWTNNSRNCIISGCCAVEARPSKRCGFYHELAKAIDPQVDYALCTTTIVNYNDTPGRTWAEVKQLILSL